MSDFGLYDLGPLVSYVQGLARALPKMRAAPNSISDSAPIWPFSQTHCREIVFGKGPTGYLQGIAILINRISVSTLDSSRAMDEVQDYAILMSAAIARDPSVGGYGALQNDSPHPMWGFWEHAGVQVRGWATEIQVKISINLSTS